ncbi:hypothetical protein PENTCL1PPCAC_9085, partial [Pristionchus entomophagus]
MKRWFNQIVSAVAYIHDKGKIHRDLKPSNIMFADEDHLKICDLGIVANRAIVDADTDQEEAKSRTFDRGTYMYMAPEQVFFGHVSSKVDIFALGLILTEMCVAMTKQEAEKV